MTTKEIAAIIESTGLPNAYYAFEEGSAEAPPFICFYYAAANDLFADDSNYQRVSNLTVELYTDEKDFAAEQSVEDALTKAGISFSKTETYISSEKLFDIVYESEVLING